MTMASFSPLAIYYCFDSADLDFCRALDLHLSPLKSNGRIQTWSDEQIFVGQEREPEREKRLSMAEVLVLLLSPDFLASERGQRQISIALQRQEAEDAIVIPILVRSCGWQETRLSILQILPREQKALNTRSHPDEAWQEVVTEISRIIATVRQWVVVVYAPEDRDVAEHLCQDREVSKLMLWSLEREKLSSDLSKDTDVRNAIRKASVVVLVASPAVPGSRVVKVQVDLAVNYRRPIIGFWVRGGDWGTSSVGDWHVDEVFDARLERYETARKALLTYVKLHGTPVPSFKRISSPGKPRNPYKGLEAFRVEDADAFFGREALVDELAATLEKILVQEKQGDQPARLLAILGASGSGKSSALMAGLLPCLQGGEVFDSQEWIYLDPISPGPHPLEELSTALSQQASMPDAVALHQAFLSDSLRTLHLFARQLAGSSLRKVVLFIDQFEEVFALMVSEEERQRFFDLLVTAVVEPQGPLLVLLTLRADFYDRPMQYPPLYRLLEAHHVSVLPLNREDLRRVIERPAQLPDVQLTFEGDLVGDLLFETREQIGALPLLQFTLDQLFKHRRGHQLTLQAYREIGGVRGALSQHVETVYQRRLTEEQRLLVRDVFLRLIEPGGSELDATRRHTNRSEFILSDPLQTLQVQEILEIFIKERLLTIHQVSGKTIIEVSHEALIREWPRLSQWLREARDDIRLQQIISKDVEEWVQRGRPTDRLYYGSELDDALLWSQRNIPSAHERAFLEASSKKRQNEVERRRNDEEKAREQQARELTLQRRATNRLRVLAGTLAIFLVIASMLSTLAVISRQQATDATQHAQQQQQFASSRALAAQADVARLNSKLDLSLLLGVKASQTNDNSQTRDSLLAALTDTPHLDTMLFTDQSGPNYAITNPVFSADGQNIFALDSQGHIIRWDIVGKQPYPLPAIPFKQPVHVIQHLTLSPDTHHLAFLTPDGLWLWDMTKNTLPTLLAENSTATDYFSSTLSFAFSSDGSQLIVVLSSCSSSDCASLQIHQWEVSTQRETHFILHFGSQTTTTFADSAALSPDGTLLAITCNNACRERQIQLWDLPTHKLFYTLPAIPDLSMTHLLYSPDGTTLASISCPLGDRTCSFIQAWKLSTRHFLRYLSAAGGINDLAFSQDGKYLMDGECTNNCANGQIEIWDLLTGALVSDPLTGHLQDFTQIALSPSGSQLVSSAGEDHLLLWNLTNVDAVTRVIRKTHFEENAKYDAILSPDWKTLIERDQDHLYVWNAADGKLLATFSPGQEIGNVAFSPSGKFLVATTANAIFIWNIRTRTVLHRLQSSGRQGWFFDHVVFSENEQMVAATYLSSTGFAFDTGLVDVWNVSSGQRVQQINLGDNLTETPDQPIMLTLSPDGSTLALARQTFVLTWNISTGKPRTQTFAGHHTTIDDLAYSPDGRILASLDNNGTLILWDTQTQKITTQFTEIQQHFARDYGRLFFSPDGVLLAVTNGFLVGSGEDSITLWDVKHARVFAHEPINNGLGPLEVPGITHVITHIIFNGDHTQMAWVLSHDNEGAVYTRDLRTAPLQNRACQVVNRNLTLAEWNQFIPTDEPYHPVCPDHATSFLPTPTPSQGFVLPTPTPTNTSAPAPTPSSGLYAQATNGPPTLSDPLTAPDRNNWVDNSGRPITADPALGIAFTHGALHISSRGCGGHCEYETYAPAISFQDLTMQVQMTFVSGSGSVGGGIIVRNDLYLVIRRDGSYDLFQLRGAELASGSSRAIHTDLGQTNLITLILKANVAYIYINGHYVDGTANAPITSGVVGLDVEAAGDQSNITEVAFRYLQLWS